MAACKAVNNLPPESINSRLHLNQVSDAGVVTAGIVKDIATEVKRNSSENDYSFCDFTDCEYCFCTGESGQQLHNYWRVPGR